jgi:hypothetical protein
MKWKNHNDESLISHDEYLALEEESKIKYYQCEEQPHHEVLVQEEVVAQEEEPSHEEEPSQED